jgi:hypothetical protein
MKNTIISSSTFILKIDKCDTGSLEGLYISRTHTRRRCMKLAMRNGIRTRTKLLQNAKSLDIDSIRFSRCKTRTLALSAAGACRLQCPGCV